MMRAARRKVLGPASVPLRRSLSRLEAQNNSAALGIIAAQSPQRIAFHVRR